MRAALVRTYAALIRPWQRPTQAVAKLHADGTMLRIIAQDCEHEIELTRKQRLEWLEVLSSGLLDEGLE